MWPVYLCISGEARRREYEISSVGWIAGEKRMARWGCRVMYLRDGGGSDIDGLPLRAIMTSIVLIMWPHPFVYASDSGVCGGSPSTCSENGPPWSLCPYHEGKVAAGTEQVARGGTRGWGSLGFESSRASQRERTWKLRADRRGDGKWSDSRARTYWADRMDAYMYVRPSPSTRARPTLTSGTGVRCASWTLAGWRVIEIALGTLPPTRRSDRREISTPRRR